MGNNMMSKRKLKALKSSIEKWEKIANKTGVDRGVRNCALCKLYFDNECQSCPVYQKTNREGCIDTPYDDWCSHHTKEHSFFLAPLNALCETCRKIAQEEVDFLKSLLPEGEK